MRNSFLLVALLSIFCCIVESKFSLFNISPRKEYGMQTKKPRITTLFKNMFKKHHSEKEKNTATSQAENTWSYSNDNLDDCGLLDLTKFNITMLKKSKKLTMPKMPWIVYVIEKVADSLEPVCLGSLLPEMEEESTSIVLTDSSCIKHRENLKKYFIYTGTQFPVAIGNPELFSIESVVIDNDTPNVFVNNAMVVTVQGEIELGDDHEVVCLPEPNSQPRYGSTCFSTATAFTINGIKHELFYTEYEAAEECKSKTHLANSVDKKIHVCGHDYRRGSMLFRGGTLLCEEDGRWVQYGIGALATHTIEGTDSLKYEEKVAESKKPSVFIDLGRFRQLMTDSQSLMKFGRLNLMRHR